MHTHQALVDYLIYTGALRTPQIISAFQNVDRADFVPPHLYKANDIYADHALSIGHGQTISQPTTVAFMFELLQPQAGEKIMDVGTGSGWTTALLAHIVGSEGMVRGVEIIPELVTFGSENVAKYHYRNATIEHTQQSYGLSSYAPYHKILVSASSSQIPKQFIDQLASDGVLVMPIYSDIIRYKKNPHVQDTVERYGGFVFVSLINPEDVE